MCAIDICIYHLSLTIRRTLIGEVVDGDVSLCCCRTGLHTGIVTLVITNLLEVSA